MALSNRNGYSIFKKGIERNIRDLWKTSGAKSMREFTTRTPRSAIESFAMFAKTVHGRREALWIF
jgi:hypothetical protein